MDKLILMGDEAVGLGAIHSGIKSVYGYPGTPSTEAFEYIQAQAKKEEYNYIHAIWSANEKVGYEEALGASYAGKRSLVTMKHVGLNVAADPFMNSALTHINGGLVLLVADDPSMHSSQSEQDSRYYADFANIICFEPSNQQEAYDMTKEAFEISERFNIPIMMRLVTRLAHSRSIVKISEPILKEVSKEPSIKMEEWTLLPVNARKRYRRLLDIQSELKKYSEESNFNKLNLEGDKSIGVIATGIAYNYLMEYFKEENILHPYLKISIYPAPEEKIRKLFETVDKVILLEEGYPFLERKLKGILSHKYKIHGRLDGTIQTDGELNPAKVRNAFKKSPLPTEKSPEINIPPRPPALCKGCPHADLYKALNEALKDYPNKRVFSDIGCYTLGALPPYNAIMTCVDMGASVSMAKGASDCGIYPSVAVIGDSTFAHSGMTPLLGAAQENTNMTLIILDNETVAMTGGQKTLASGEVLKNIVKGLGVKEEHICELIPLPKNHEENVQKIKKEIEYKGLSVIISKRECIQTAKKKRKKNK